MASSSSSALLSSTSEPLGCSATPASSSPTHWRNPTSSKLYTWEEIPPLPHLVTSSFPSPSDSRRSEGPKGPEEDSHPPPGGTEGHSCPCRCIYTSLMLQLASSYFSSSSSLPTASQEPAVDGGLSSEAFASTASPETSSASLPAFPPESKGAQADWEWECSVCTALQATAKYHLTWLFESSGFYSDNPPAQTTLSNRATASLSVTYCPSCTSLPEQLGSPSSVSHNGVPPSSLPSFSRSMSKSSRDFETSSPSPSSVSLPSCSSSSSLPSCSSSLPSCSSLCTAFICKSANSLRSTVARNALRTATCLFRSCLLHLERKGNTRRPLPGQADKGVHSYASPETSKGSTDSPPVPADDEAMTNASEGGENKNEAVLSIESEAKEDRGKGKKVEVQEEEGDFLLNGPGRRRMVELCNGLFRVLISKAGLSEKKFLAVEASQALNLFAIFLGRLEEFAESIQPPFFSPPSETQESDTRFSLLSSVLKHLESQRKQQRTSSPAAEFLRELVKSCVPLEVSPSSPSGLNRWPFSSASVGEPEDLSSCSSDPCESAGKRRSEREDSGLLLHNIQQIHPSATSCTSPSRKPRSCSTPHSDPACSPSCWCSFGSSSASVSSPSPDFLKKFSLPGKCLPLLLSFSKSPQPQARQAARSAIEVLATALFRFYRRGQFSPSVLSSPVRHHHQGRDEEEEKKKREKEAEKEKSAKTPICEPCLAERIEEEEANEEMTRTSGEETTRSSLWLVGEKGREKRGKRAGEETEKKNNKETTAEGHAGRGNHSSLSSSGCLGGRAIQKKNQRDEKRKGGGGGEEEEEEGKTAAITVRESPLSLVVSLLESLPTFSPGKVGSASCRCVSSTDEDRSCPAPDEEEKGKEEKTASGTPQKDGGGRREREEQEREERRRRRQEDEDRRVLSACAISALKKIEQTGDSSSSFSPNSSVFFQLECHSRERIDGLTKEASTDGGPERRRREGEDKKEKVGGDQENGEEEKEEIFLERDEEQGLRRRQDGDGLKKNERPFLTSEEKSPRLSEEDEKRAREKAQDEARNGEEEVEGNRTPRGRGARQQEEKGGCSGKRKSPSSSPLCLVVDPAPLSDDTKERERGERDQRENGDAEEEEEEEKKKKRPLTPLLLFSPRKHFGTSTEDDLGEEEEERAKLDKEKTLSSLTADSTDGISPTERRKKRKKAAGLGPRPLNGISFPLSSTSSPHTTPRFDCRKKPSSAGQEEQNSSLA